MTLARKVAQNTIIQFAGKIVGTILALITVSLMMRYLGKVGFGEYTTIIGFLGTFSILADLGLYLVVTREISKQGANEGKIVNNALTIKLLAAIFVLSIAPLAALLFPYSRIVVIGIAIGTISFLFTSLNQILIGIFQKHFRMDKVAIGEVAGRAFWLLGVALVAKLDLGLLVMVGAIAVSNFINFFIVFLFANKYVKIKLDFDWDYWKKIMKIALPLAFSVVFTLVHFKVDTVLLSVLKPAEDVGIYGAAYKVLEGLITFAAIFAGLLLPVLSKYAFTKKEMFIKIYRKGFDVLAIFVTPLIFGTLFFAEPLMVLFGGDEFEISSKVLRILIFAVGAIFFAHLFGNTMVAINQQKKMMWIYFTAAVVSIASNLILIPRFSYFGAAATTVITESLVCIFTALVVFTTAKVSPQFNTLFKSILSAMLMSAVIIILPDWHYFINISLAVVAYFSFLYLMRGFSKEMVVEVLSFRNK